MHRPGPIESPEIVEFVRRALGCECPDEVFHDLSIDLLPERFAGLPVESVLEVGGRLLVMVCSSAHWRKADAALERILEVGLRARDAAGFNRLRIVVATPDPATAEPDLSAHFSRLSHAYERVFLHVLEPSLVPDVLRHRSRH